MLIKVKSGKRLWILASILVIACNLPALLLVDIGGYELRSFKEGLTSSYASHLKDLVNAPRYVLSLVISDDYQQVTGSCSVRFTNSQNISLAEIVFHLFPNLLGGSMQVSAVSVDETPTLPIIESSGAIMRLPLGTLLEPGDHALIQIEYSINIPTEGGSNFGVLSYENRILSLAHAYPTLAVFAENGWDTYLPSPLGDILFNEAGFYQVTIDAPLELVLVASGVETSREQAASRQQVKYMTGPARDFYLAASPDYLPISLTTGEVTINSYSSAEYLASAQAAMEIAAQAIQFYSETYGPYPYTEFDIVPITTSALGIEFPGITGISQNLYDDPSYYYFELAVAHEVGHQWFYNLVGNNQQIEPWLDESITQYLVLQYFTNIHPERVQEFFTHVENNLAWLGDQVIPIGQPAGAFSPDTYISIIYNRGPLFLQALADILGQPRLNAFLYEYIQTNLWKNASPVDFKAQAEGYCQCDLTPTFVEWVYP